MAKEFIQDYYKNNKRYKKNSKFKGDGLVYLPGGIQKTSSEAANFSPSNIPVLIFNDDGKAWKRSEQSPTMIPRPAKQQLEDNIYFPQAFKIKSQTAIKKQRSQKVL